MEKETKAPGVSLIIPMYNESAILPETLAAVSAYMEERFLDDYEVIYVDDGSADGSSDIVEKVGYPHTRVLRNAENHGKGYVVRAGMLAARGEIRIFTDCDLAYGTAVIGEMETLFAENAQYDAVVGSRDKHPEGYLGYSPLRKLASRVYRAVLRLFFGLRLSDSQSGIKGFRAEAAETVFSLAETNGYAFDFEAILLGSRLGLTFGEMPVKIIGNRPGHVRVLRDGLRMLRELCRIRRRVKGLKISKNAEN